MCTENKTVEKDNFQKSTLQIKSPKLLFNILLFSTRDNWLLKTPIYFLEQIRRPSTLLAGNSSPNSPLNFHKPQQFWNNLTWRSPNNLPSECSKENINIIRRQRRKETLCSFLFSRSLNHKNVFIPGEWKT